MARKYRRKGRKGKKKGFRRRKMANPLGQHISNAYRKLRVHIDAMVPFFIDNVAQPNVATTQVAFPLNFPTMWRNQAGTYQQITVGGSALSVMWPKFLGGAAVFDEYKVLRMVVTFVPQAVETILSTASYSATDAPALIYSYNDLDDTAQVGAPEEGVFMNCGSFPKSYAPGKPITWSYRQPKEKRKFYLNAQNFGVLPSAASENDSLPYIPNPYGGMKLLHVSPGSGEGAAIVGRLYVRWECIFRGIRQSV